MDNIEAVAIANTERVGTGRPEPDEPEHIRCREQCRLRDGRRVEIPPVNCVTERHVNGPPNSYSLYSGFVSAALWSPDSCFLLTMVDWGKKNAVEGCYTNERLVTYSVPGFVQDEIMNLCSLKLELFGWISDWRAWMQE